MKQLAETIGLKFYRAYGLTFKSELVFPELIEIEPCDADIDIVNAPIARRQEYPTRDLFLDASDTDVYLEYSYIGRFLIQGTTRIMVDRNHDLAPRLENLIVVGPVLGILLQLHRRLTLHGSAIQSGSATNIFLGDKGAGKSTLASALVSAGNELITDDISAVRFDQTQRPWLDPGFPQVKLSFEATSLLPLPGSSITPTPAEGFPKNRIRLGTGFAQAASPVTACYVLERGERLDVKTMSKTDALASLLRYSYSVKFGRDFLKDSIAITHFRDCVTLSNMIPVKRLVIPYGIDALSDVASALSQ